LINTDVVIVGAGPCGLFQVFQLGLLGLKSEIIDSIKQPGGQCSELYPDKPIYDIPAISVCSGEELTQRLLKQIDPFDYGLHVGEEVSALKKQNDQSFIVKTNTGKKFNAKAIVISAGVGSFQPRRLRVSGIDAFVKKSLHYRITDKNNFTDKKVAILGGGDSALDWTIELSGIAKETVLIHRRDDYRAATATIEKMRKLHSAGKIDCMENTEVSEIIGNGQQITSIETRSKDGVARSLDIDHVLVFFGLAPKLGPIADWGLDINRKTINVDNENFETSESGIYAIGDISHYPGKKKLILCGFHEATLVAFAIKQRLNPNKKVHLQYTTTSSIMHERLGVKD